MLKLILFIFIAITYFALPKRSADIKFVRFRKIIPVIIILTIMICLIIFSDSTYIIAKDAFMLWASNIVPSLLPFFICTGLLKRTPFIKLINKILTPLMKPIFNIPGCGAFAFSMGMMSGYPTGAKISAELYSDGECSREEAERLLAFTNTSGPLFIISAVGIGMFKSPQIGLLLLLTHFLGSLTVGLIFKWYKNNSLKIISQKTEEIKGKSQTSANFKASCKEESEYLNFQNLGLIMGDVIQNSIATLLLILGYIVSFSILGDILIKLNIIPGMCNLLMPMLKIVGISRETGIGIIKGVLEVTSGLNELTSLLIFDNLNLAIILSAFLLGFGGLSVMMQTASIVAKSKLSMKAYLIGKTLHGTISAIYTYFILKYTSFFKFDIVETFSYACKYPVILEETTNMISTFLGLVLVCIVYVMYANRVKNK